MSSANQPIVCTLTTKEQASQALEWRNLHRHRLTSEPIEGGAVMTFPIGLADGVEDLAAREANCCAFLDIVSMRGDETVTVQITSQNAEAAPVIAMLSGVAAP